jgi:gamma-glutamyltranspeptidase/glutathione hydrolase
LAGAIRANQEQLAKYQGNRGNLLKLNGHSPNAGEVLKQPDLAETYRAIAEHGTAWFYGGPYADASDAWFKQNGGILSGKDLAAYRALEREPLVTDYRGYQIVGYPPPSSGGVHVAQILNILENFPLAEIYRENAAEFQHIVAEAIKLAFADRAYWLGDPDFVQVPRGLVDKAYARQLAARIDRSKAIEVKGHGDPTSFDSRLFSKHTTHIAAADRAGHWVAITTTVNTTFGSKVVVPGTGVILNNQMDDFAIAPGTPNAFGLVGADANAIEPGKRPLSSMSPTIVCKEGKPVLTVGAAGGPRIITEVVLAIVRFVDLKSSLADAVALPRIHQQWSPNVLFVESNFDRISREKLTAMGHDVRLVNGGGICQAISFDEASGMFVGVHDPRTNGKAAGR